MTIGSINIAMGASYGAYNQKLTQQTRQQLEALGIPYSPTITEQEGKALLRKAQSAPKSNNQNLSKDKNPNTKDELFERAQKLAQKLGIGVQEGIGLNALLEKIESVLEQKINANQDNIDMLKTLKGFSQELSMIQAQANTGAQDNKAEQALMKSLEVLSMYNKNFLAK